MFKKDGKLFGKISIIDICVVLIFVLLIAGLYIKFSGSSAVDMTSGQNIECTLKVEKVRQYTVDALTQGGAVYDESSKEYIGEIINVTSAPAEYSLEMADGSYDHVVLEDRYDAFVTVAFKGKAGENGYYTSSNRQMGVGGTVEMNTKFAQCEGTIVEIGVVEK